MLVANDEKLDEAVYQWFVQKRGQDMTVSMHNIAHYPCFMYPAISLIQLVLGPVAAG